MATIYDSITPELADFIARQPIYFVATAPKAENGHVNLSPKGIDSFRVLSPTEVVYLDLTGSGNETAAHLAENGRITIMFCAFEGNPRILRLYGRGRTVLPGTKEYEPLLALFPAYPGIRQIVTAGITRVQTSCGFGVPLMEFVCQRDTLARWAEKQGEEGLAEYRKRKNAVSIDGLSAPMNGA